jgi:hypothetical protein
VEIIGRPMPVARRYGAGVPRPCPRRQHAPPCAQEELPVLPLPPEPPEPLNGDRMGNCQLRAESNCSTAPLQLRAIIDAEDTHSPAPRHAKRVQVWRAEHVKQTKQIMSLRGAHSIVRVNNI